MIRKHGGYMQVESTVDKGATFKIYLPTSIKMAADESDKEILSKPKGGRKILIMDDERDIRTILGSFLESYGYEVDYAVNGDQALELFKATYDRSQADKSIKKHHMVILNMTIPGGKGARDIIKDIKTIDPQVYAVLSTGHSQESIEVSSYQEQGFQALLLKPFESTSIIKMLNKLEEEVG